MLLVKGQPINGLPFYFIRIWIVHYLFLYFKKKIRSISCCPLFTFFAQSSQVI